MSIATGWVCAYWHNAKTTWSRRWHDNMKINTLWGKTCQGMQTYLLLEYGKIENEF